MARGAPPALARAAPSGASLVRGIDAVRERFGDDAVRFGRDLVHPDRMRKATETEDE